jgi:asparagine synthase (glutamine-hydrolysing)
MVIDESGMHITKYWDIDYNPNRLSEEQCVETFEALFEESVRLRLISEVPLGVFLSGGIDSTATLAMMSRITERKQIKTFSVGYEVNGASGAESEASNEFRFAREAATHFGADHHEFSVSASQFREAIPLMAHHLDEPLADPSCIPLYFISKLAREHITVVLSGEGADETLAGYSLYQRVLKLDGVRRRLGPLSSLALMGAQLPLNERVSGYMNRIGSPLEAHYRGVVKGIGSDTRRRLIGDNRFGRCEQRLNEIFGSYFRQSANASLLNQMLYADAKVWLPENLLLKADKMTMATAVELRVPFLDHKLVEFLATCPDSVKIRQGKGKWMLRQIMRDKLPASILQRPKKGFPSPTKSWLRFELRDFVRDLLLSRDAACADVFDRRSIANVIQCHEQGRFSGYQEVWSLVVFELWHRQFIKQAHAVGGTRDHNYECRSPRL